MPRLPKQQELQGWLAASYSYHFLVTFELYSHVVCAIGIDEATAERKVKEAFPGANEVKRLTTALRIVC